MLNSLVFSTAGIISKAFHTFGITPYLREKSDPRFVFYHGIGNGKDLFMANLKDELPEADFVAHIKYLKKNYHIVSIEEFLSQIEDNTQNKPSKPLCVISFDDGLKSVYQKAMPLLKESDTPFTVFVNTHSVDNENLLWLHLLSYLIETVGELRVRETLSSLTKEDLTSSEIHLETWLRSHIKTVHQERLLQQVAVQHDIDITWVAKHLQPCLSWDEIKQIHNNGGSIYSHTHHHLPLGAFNKREIQSELEISQMLLKEHGFIKQNFVSLPFGMTVDFGHQAIPIAQAIGHDYVLEVGDGKNSTQRIKQDKVISRVCLGECAGKPESIYAAVEIIPLIKNKLKFLKALLNKK